MIRVAPSALAALTQLLQGRTHSMKDTLSKAFIYTDTVVHTVYSNLGLRQIMVFMQATKA